MHHLSTSATSSLPLIRDDPPVDEKDMPATERALAELLEGIDIIYFRESEFQAVLHEIQKLTRACSANLEIDALEMERFKLKRQMQVVSRKISTLIICNSLEFNRKVESYEELRTRADQLLSLIRQFRSLLEIGRRKCNFLMSILACNYKKRISFLLKQELTVMVTLRNSVYRIKALIEDDNILEFLHIIVEAVNVTHQYRHYAAIKQLSLKYLKYLGLMEHKIDEILAAQTKQFNPEKYDLLISAYRLLGDFKSTSTKLLTYFYTSLHDVSRSIVLDLLKENLNVNVQQEVLDTYTYEELCKLIESKKMTRSLCEIGASIIGILYNYHQMLKFHIKDDKSALQAAMDEQFREQQQLDIQSNIFETQLVERGIIQKSLIDNAYSCFDRAGDLYNTLLKAFDFSTVKFDQFLKVIDISERFRKFGHKYFGNSCFEIEHTLEYQSKSYFERHHNERMDEVKMFLENETFTLCPVSAQFNLFDLPEFYFIKENGALQKDLLKNDNFDNVLDLYVEGKQINFVLFEQRNEEIFSEIEESEQICDKLCDRRTSSSQSSSRCGIFEETFDELIPNSMPNLCNSTLNLLRIIGRYIRMSTFLRPTAEFTIDAIVKLYNYYIFAIFSFFCTDVVIEQQQQLFGTTFTTLRLRQLMQSISSDTLGNTKSCSEGDNDEREQERTDLVERSLNLNSPTLSRILNRDDQHKLFLLAERIVGIESVIFLAKQMELLRPFIESLLPKREHNTNLDLLYKNLPAVLDLREAAFGCVAAKAICYPEILRNILSLDWNLNQIRTQHSFYVDTIVEGYAKFRQEMERLYAYVHISTDLHCSIWSMMLLCTMRILVQGYAEAKKCTIEGRALQLLDIEQLCIQLEEIIGIKPLPNRSYAENYIKAFYLPMEELNQWIVHHTEYSLNQTSALLNAASYGTNTKKATISRIMMNLLDVSGISEGHL